MNTIGVFSHKSDHWSTPSDVYALFLVNGFKDPCPLNADFDGLNRPDLWLGRVFVNPPYSDVSAWVDRAINACSAGSLVVMLLPVRSDTSWFKKLVEYRCAFYFVRGRMKFGGSKSGAPFPSMFVVLDPGDGGSCFMYCDCLSSVLDSIGSYYL